MLGKLLKFDLKHGLKIFLLLHGILIIISLLGRFLFLDQLNFNEPDAALVSSVALFASAIIFLFAAVCFCTWLLIAFRFYRNLFTGEGYLTWTLPASSVQHLWSKILSGSILLLLDCIIESACTLLLVTGSNVTEAYSMIASDVNSELGMSLSTFALILFVIMLVSGPVSVIQTYFCIVIGQLFPAHRVLGAVAAYFISSFVIQILSFGLQIGTGLFPEYVLIGQTSTSDQVGTYLFTIMGYSTVMMIVIAVLQYLVIHYIMKKKINLL